MYSRLSLAEPILKMIAVLMFDVSSTFANTALYAIRSYNRPRYAATILYLMNLKLLWCYDIIVNYGILFWSMDFTATIDSNHKC